MSINLFPADSDHDFTMSQADNDWIDAHMKMGFTREACVNALRKRRQSNVAQPTHPWLSQGRKSAASAVRSDEAHFAVEALR